MAENPNTQLRAGNEELTPTDRIARILHDQIVSGSVFLSAFDRLTTDKKDVTLLVGNEVDRAGVVGENKEIPLAETDQTEVKSEPVKYAQMRKISNEAIADTTPGILERNTKKLASAIYKGIDEDFLTAAKQTDVNKTAPTGVLNHAELKSAGEVKDNLDAVKDAVAEIADAEGSASLFIVHPLDAAEMRKIKVKLADKTDGNTYLLQGDQIADGLTVIEHKAMTRGTALIADREAVTAVVRKTMDVKLFDQRYAEFDATGVRGTFRASWVVTAPGKLRTVKVPTKATVKADDK
ncbi:phage major capsid protein [Streptomyces sp. NRRL B-1347]|uniref:phage major capsid family protein n=1 Tax=Streptomyces sp. NRRL B-1347 TaxID=1476877 RepID=UPI0004C4A4F5|nr:phage major capsid protein [Streptomyces sp. NRRL B-1347]